MTVNQMRCKVAEAYSGPLWRLKVQEMPDKQIIAVYKDMEQRGVFEPKKKPKTKLNKEPKCEQLTIWDFINKE